MGYGQIGVGGKVLYVHRAAWVERHGPIPPETPYVLHRCDNPPCWADEHLWLGTHADNMADMTAKARQMHHVPKTRCPAGHLFDEENTYVRPRDGGRQCRTCARVRAKAWYHAHPKTA